MRRSFITGARQPFKFYDQGKLLATHIFNDCIPYDPQTWATYWQRDVQYNRIWTMAVLAGGTFEYPNEKQPTLGFR